MSLQSIYSKKSLLNLFIIFIPITYVTGNLLFNVNLLILIIITFLFYRLDVFKIKYNLIDKILLLLFCYIILNGIYNNFFNFNFPEAPDQNVVLFKSILFLRYLFLYFVIRFLVTSQLIDLRLLFFSFGLSALFVSFDLIIQYIFGRNLFGMVGDGRRLAGLFGDEYIAGGYIQRFFIFLPYAFLLFSKIKNKFINQFTFFLIINTFLLGILFSGNRVPLIMSILILILIFIYEKKLRLLIISLFIFFSLSFSFLLKTNNEYLNHFHSFKNRTSEFLDYFKKRVSTTASVGYVKNAYIKEFESGVLTWQRNKVTGGGIKSFYFNCVNIDKQIMKKYIGSCNSHPHNFYLEITASLGIIGLIIVLALFFLILFEALKIIHFSKAKYEFKSILLPLLIVFVAEIFPIKTSGSFFTTMTGNYLFIIIPFIVGLIDLNKSKIDYERK